MAFEIQAIDSENFLLNGDPKGRSFKAFAKGDNISVLGVEHKVRSITNGSNLTNFVTKDAGGIILFDGGAGATAQELVVSINSIVSP